MNDLYLNTKPQCAPPDWPQQSLRKCLRFFLQGDLLKRDEALLLHRPVSTLFDAASARSAR